MRLALWQDRMTGVYLLGTDNDRGMEETCRFVGPCDELCRRAPDPQLAALVEVLERIAWHELTWKEARDIARAALAAAREGAADERR